MDFKTLLCPLLLLVVSSAYAADNDTGSKLNRNLCDDLRESGKSNEAQIKKCMDNPKFGPSPYYKDQVKQAELKEQIKISEAAAAEKKAAEVKNNIEFKTYSSADLREEGFGKDFYAKRVNYTKSGKINGTKVLTDGDALCKYLGYEKSVKATVASKDIIATEANKNGMVIPTNVFGVTSKAPELFSDDDNDYIVKKYTSVTCAKTLSDSAVAKEALAKMESVMDEVNENLPATSTGKGAKVDDSSRRPAVKEFGDGDKVNAPARLSRPQWADTPILGK